MTGQKGCEKAEINTSNADNVLPGRKRVVAAKLKGPTDKVSKNHKPPKSKQAGPLIARQRVQLASHQTEGASLQRRTWCEFHGWHKLKKMNYEKVFD